MDRREIAAVLASAGLRPQHHFGQNFMVDQRVLAAIADAGQVQPSDLVLEVGPGVGNLTRLLSQQARAVLAVDIDRKLLPAARAHHAPLKNVTWLEADVLAGKHEVEPQVLAELRRLQRSEPWLDPLQLLRTVTVNPARALRRENQLGRITPGALADLIAIPFSHKMETIHEEVVAFAKPIPWMMIDGKIRL